MNICKVLFFFIFYCSGVSYAQENKLFFSDWKRVCQTQSTSSPAKDQSKCVIEKFAFKDKELKVRIAGLSIQHVKEKKEYGIAVISPLGVKISHGVDFQISGMKSINLPFLFCDQPGCFSQFLADKTLMDNLYTSNFIKLRYQLINDQYLEIGFDISGLQKALKYLD